MPSRQQVAREAANVGVTNTYLNVIDENVGQIANLRQILRNNRTISTLADGAVPIRQNLPNISGTEGSTQVTYNQIKNNTLYSYFNRNIINELNSALESIRPVNRRPFTMNSSILLKISYIPEGEFNEILKPNIQNNTGVNNPLIQADNTIYGNIYTNRYGSKNGFLYASQVIGNQILEYQTISDLIPIPEYNEENRFERLRQSLVNFSKKLQFEGSSSAIWWFTGFRIIIPAISPEGPRNLIDYAARLRAYDYVSNQAFQNMTKSSTSISKNCIYQTYYYLYENDTGLLARKTDEIVKLLKEETEEIQQYVLNGEILNFMKAKSLEIGEPMYLEFFNKDSELQDDDENTIYGFEVIGDDVNIITDLRVFNGNKVFLYCDEHVQPRKDITYKRKTHKDKETKYMLKKEHHFRAYKTDKTIIAYDIETRKDVSGKQIPYCLNIYGDKIKGWDTDKSFYGDDCVKEFVEYLETLVIPLNTSKTHQKTKTQYYYFYGYNNSTFDNILIFEELQKKFKFNNNEGSYICTGNGFKFITVHNVKILDLMSYYPGGLAYCAKSFKLKDEKLTFPHRFIDSVDKISYIGDVPDIECLESKDEVKYWESIEDLKNYVEKFGKKIDIEDYCRKHYCRKDVIITYQIAKNHIENCIQYVGNWDSAMDEIKKLPKGAKNLETNVDFRITDVSDCPTAAGISVKIFKCLYQEENLYSSPMEEYERQAYMGGRTEVFKKRFNGDFNEYLTYVDFNSSYPYSMTKKMPVRYVGESKYDEVQNVVFIDHYLYFSRIEYKGSQKNYIPNCLYRSDKGDIIATKNQKHFPRWGIELNRAVKDGCDVYTNRCIQYEGKPIFEKMMRYYYDLRNSCKKENPAKGMFIKTVLNSLYGKTGQNIKSHYKVCADDVELNNILSRAGVYLESYDEFSDGRIKIKYHDDKIEEHSIGHLVRFASYIAACSRAHLADCMALIGHENVYYCDTDSIIYGKCNNPEGLKEELHNSELGKLKKEKYDLKKNEIYETACGKRIKVDEDYEGEYKISKAYFLAPKTYSYEYFVEIGKHSILDENDDKKVIEVVDKACYNLTTYKSKGIREKDMEYEYYDEIYKMHLEGDESKAIMNPSMFIRKLDEIKVIPMERHIKCVYNKRIWNGDESEAYTEYEEWYANRYG